ISGCQDNQTSMDGEHNGAFTEQLLKVWNRGGFNGDYNAFHGRIRASMPSTQSPNLFVLGKAAAFLKQKPFTV
ncbi:MAG: caspase family protein, partial [Burkholderiales bacterium]